MSGEAAQKTWRDWLWVVTIALVIILVIVGPFYVVRVQHRETERIVAAIEDQASRRLEQMILVNTFTISCLLAIPPEERTDLIMQDCIESGFEQAPDIDHP